MKIENNGLTPLAPKNTNATSRLDKKYNSGETQSVSGGRDKAEVSGNARLLAKARVALDATDQGESEQVSHLRTQVQSGDYTVQVEDVARKLAGKFTPR